METMASVVSNLLASSSFSTLTEFKPQPRAQIRCSATQESSVISPDSVRVNGVSSVKERDRTIPSSDMGHGHLAGLSTRKKIEKKGEEEAAQEKLKPLWDDGYGSQSVKDYLDLAKDIIKPDGGPPRWFSPISCGAPLKDSPILFFLPGNLIFQDSICNFLFAAWA